METLQTPTDEIKNENDDIGCETSKKVDATTNTQELLRFEGKVTPEQELSASVARKRRNISKKRSESAHRPRDVTPARELLEKPNDDEEERPIIPERKLKKTNSNNNSKHNENNENDDQQEKIEKKKTGNKEIINEQQNKNNEKTKNDKSLELKGLKETTNGQETLDKLKNTLTLPREKPARLKRDSKLLMKKRSQSAPRPASEELGSKDDLQEQKTKLKQEKEILESTIKMQDVTHANNEKIHKLIEDFKQAQIKSAATEIVTPDYVSSSEESTEEPLNTEGVRRRKPYAPAAQQYLERRRLEKGLSTDSEKASESLKQKRMTFKELRHHWKQYKAVNTTECERIRLLRNKCMSEIGLIMIFCGLGGIVFKFTEGAFENFYKCGVKRVKRDFIEILWRGSHNLKEEDWKSLARTKLRDFEEQLHTAHEAGVHTYSGQRAWTFLNGIIYCLTIITTIGEFPISYFHVLSHANNIKTI